MSNFNVSKPVDLKGLQRSEVYEYFPDAKKIDQPTPAEKRAGAKPIDQRRSIIFLNRGKTDALKDQELRDRIFTRITAAENNLKSRTVIEISEITDTEYSYTYREDGQLVRKTLEIYEFTLPKAKPEEEDKAEDGVEEGDDKENQPQVSASDKKFLFVNRTKGDALKEAEQRDKIFRRIASAEPTLLKGTLIDITHVSAAHYTYSYLERGRTIVKNIGAEEGDANLDPLGGGAAPEKSSLAQTLHTTSKVHELTLSEFKQSELGGTVVQAIKAVLNFLATPFAAFYRLVAGGEARQFADMLIPVQHDRVGELTHDRILSQFSFLARFLRSEVKTEVSQGLEEVRPQTAPLSSYYAPAFGDDNAKAMVVGDEKTDKNGKIYYEAYIEQVKHFSSWDYAHNRIEIIDLKKTTEARHFDKKLRKRGYYHVLNDEEMRSADWQKGEFAVRYNGEIVPHRNLTEHSVDIMPRTWVTHHLSKQKHDKEIRIIDLKKTAEESRKSGKYERHYLDPDQYGILDRLDDEDKIKLYAVEYNGRICQYRTLNKAGVELLASARLVKIAKDRNHTFYDGEVRPYREEYNYMRHGYVYKVSYGEDESNAKEVEPAFIMGSFGGGRPAQEEAIPLTDAEQKPTVTSKTEEMALIFEEAVKLGKMIHQARNSGSQTKSEKAAIELRNKLNNLGDKQKHLLISTGYGEGKNYVPQFLLFEYVPSRIVGPGKPGEVSSKTAPKLIMKHICFSSTSAGNDLIEAVKSYDVSTKIGDDESLDNFFRSLIATYPYSRSKDASEVTLKGPMTQDLSFESLLTTFGTLIPSGEGASRTRVSRDPVKALFTILNELNIQEAERSEMDNDLVSKITSKSNFFKFYVDNLIDYYEKNESKLTKDERARSLDGILWYANKVRHYMEKEIGVDAALALSEHLLAFVEAKLGELKRTEQLEETDLKNLEGKVTTFWATLEQPFTKTLEVVTETKDVEGSRVSLTDSAKVEEVRIAVQYSFAQPADVKKGERAKAYQAVLELLKSTERHLNHKQLLAAKTLMLSLMQALPAARPSDPTKHKTMWDEMDVQELDQWSQALEKMGASFFEAAARSGTYPLSPHEVFEIQVFLPLLQRYLLQLKIPLKTNEFNQAWDSYKTNNETKQKLTTKLAAFVAMREKQIEEETTKRLTARWEEEDRQYKARWETYRSDLAYYNSQSAKYAAAKNDWDRRRIYVPALPTKPKEIDKVQQKKDRDAELKNAIITDKQNDIFLQELKAVRIDTMNWDAMITGVRTERMIAVMSAFAKIIGISKELLSYKIHGDTLMDRTSYRTSENEEIWLMRKDCSVLIGSSPFFDKRFEACERTFEELNWDDQREGLAQDKWEAYLIGYDGKGDGTQFEFSNSEQQKERGEYRKLIRARVNGYFNKAAEGHEVFVPAELAACRKVVEMRKILNQPENYLKSHSSSIFGAIINRLGGGSNLSAHSLKKTFQEMHRIHFVATAPSGSSTFSLSTSADKEGSLAVDAQLPEQAPILEQRSSFLGQSNVDMCRASVGADRERREFHDIANHRLFKLLGDAGEEFVLRESALSKGPGERPSSNLGDSIYPYSYLAISQCFHFIYQYPEKLEIPSVQHTLFKTFFQPGLIREHILNNPDYFINVGPLLKQICRFMSGKENLKGCELFLREVCNRIRRQALDLAPDLKARYGGKKAKEISEALPEYTKATMGDACLALMDKKNQKEFATYALGYYCSKFEPVRTNTEGKPTDYTVEGIPTDDITEWTKALNALFIMQKSTAVLGHSGFQAELLYKAQTLLLPAIGKAIKDDESLRNQLLKELSGKDGKWQLVPQKEYTYSIQEGDQQFIVDLRTGQGFKTVIKLGEKCKLPEQIRSDKEQFQFLFKDANPTVTSIEYQNGITDYVWKNEQAGSEVVFRYNNKGHRKTFQILQTIRGQQYLFQKVKLSDSKWTKIWQFLTRHKNQTVETLIESKGLWVPIDKKTLSHDTSHVLVAQHEQSLEKDPITLLIKGDKIVEASVGKGEEKKLICSGLSDKDATLLSCRDGKKLLLLSKDGKTVDEIRFPVDPDSHDQLILKRSDGDSQRWVVSGREDWEWQLTNTHEYESRFGKNWRHYILPLKNRRTGEQEFWIIPHLVAGSSKKGEDVKFLRSAVDFLDAAGGMMGSAGGLEGVDPMTLRAYAGAAERFAGGAANAVEAVEEFGGGALGGELGLQRNQQNQMFGLLKNIASPRPVRYRVERRSESGSHVAFFYLSLVASKRQDWATASRYLELMGKCGHSTPEDIKQLQQMAMMVLGFETMNDATKSLMAPQSPLEVAYRAKLASHLLALNTTLKASHGIELFTLPANMPAIPGLNGIKPLDIIKGGGAGLFFKYRESLAQHGAALREHGLLLTKQEEKVFTSDAKSVAMGSMGGLLGKEKLKDRMEEADGKEKAFAHPYQLELPTVQETEKMVKAMTAVANPRGVWSIHDLHKEKGAYPKWETVLANFWVYWEWIHINNLPIQDISFLFLEVPKSTAYAKEIDTARRLLLLRWHHSKSKEALLKDHRNITDVTMDALYRDVRSKMLDLTDMASITAKEQQLMHDAAISPGIFATGWATVYKGYAALRRELGGLSYKENIGGVEHTANSRHKFVQASNNLLNHYLNQIADSIRGSNVLTIESIEPPQDYVAPPTPVPKPTPLEKRRMEAAQACVPLFDGTPLQGQFGKELLLSLGSLMDAPKEEVYDNLIQLFVGFAELRMNTDGDLIRDQVKDTFEKIPNLKRNLERIAADYQNEVGIPQHAYPKQIEKGNYEPVTIRLPGEDLKWGDRYFTDSRLVWNQQSQKWEEGLSLWEKRSERAKAYFAAQADTKEREQYKLEKILAGIEEAKNDLLTRTGHSFNVTQLEAVRKEIKHYLKDLKKEEKLGRERILEFARSHASELGILHLFADRNRFTKEQIFDQVLDLYRYGQLDKLENKELQIYFAELITESLLVTTERQQYGKALDACRDLYKVLRGIIAKIPHKLDVDTKQKIAQTLANQSVDWILYSSDLKRLLEEGSDRLRYAVKLADGTPVKTADGHYMLRNQQFTRRYLVSDIRNHWISRTKAIAALENMMKDLKKSDREEKPVRFIRAKMGTGKSDFVFPESIDLFLQYGYRPIMITTDELVSQLHESMGHKAFVFKFDINFGLTDSATPEEIETHLKTLLQTFERLDGEGKAILTSPSQMGGLRDKRVHLQESLRMAKAGPESQKLFTQLQLVKRIEAFLKDKRVRYLIDEDVNFDNSYEYNYAIGEFRTVDKSRFAVAEELVYLIESKYKTTLWSQIVNNDMRSIQNTLETFTAVAEDMYENEAFWKSVDEKFKWKEKIVKAEFVEFVLGLRETLPSGLVWNPKKDEEQQQIQVHVAALKTFLSKTLESVRGVNPYLERGISKTNGVTVVPYSDGEEKVGVLYGEESETILHHIFHYLGVCNDTGKGKSIGEDIFLEKEKELGASDLPISPGRAATWKDWSGRIAEVANRYESHYEAFVKAPELAIQRFQFLRHIMLETPEIRIYLEQITYNSQDLGLGADIRVGSGTGQPFALNLSDYTDGMSQSADAVYGETLLCFDLDEGSTTFTHTPLEFIKEQAKDPQCQAILNYDYDVYGNNTDRVAEEIRREGRQVIYRDQNLDKKMWYPGDQYFAMRYEPGAISPSALFYYARKDSRGVHFHVPRGGHRYGMAMVGTANKEDPIAQLLWRLRHLDMGHRAKMAHDEKTARQVRKALKLEADEKIRIGHLFRYFTLNTIEEEDVKDVKAVIFKAQTPIKTHFDAEARRTYDLSGMQDPQFVHDLEGNVIVPSTRGLYILSSRINWAKEFEAQKMMGPVDYVLKLYESEEERLRDMLEGSKEKKLKGFNDHLQDLLTSYPQMRRLYDGLRAKDWIQQQLDLSSNVGYNFETALASYLHLNSRGLGDDLAHFRELLRKEFGIRLAARKALAEIKAEVAKITGPDSAKSQDFLKKNLPEKIAADPGTSRNEQKTQQLQQQEQKQQVQQVERHYTPAYSSEPTKPLDFDHFKSVALGAPMVKPTVSPYASHYYSRFSIHEEFRTNGHFLPLNQVLNSKLYVTLDPALYENAYISHRAWELLTTMGVNGAPVVQLLVVQSEDGKQAASVIVTPADCDESIAPAMIEERKAVLVKKGLVLPPPFNEDQAYGEISQAFEGMAPAIAQRLGVFVASAMGGVPGIQVMIQGAMTNQKARVLPYMRQFLTKPGRDQAWTFLTNNADTIIDQLGFGAINIPGVGSLKAIIKAIMPDLRDPMLATHKKYQEANPVGKKLDTDRIAVYALSSELFNPMLMDVVNRPQEESYFVQLMAMNKVYLNWTQFTLREMDFLITLVSKTNKRIWRDDYEFDQFLERLRRVHCSEVCAYLKILRELELPDNAEFVMKLVKRKLDENYIDTLQKAQVSGASQLDAFSPVELAALRKWIIQQGRNVEIAVQKWQKMGALSSVEFVRKFRQRIREEEAAKADAIK